MPAHTDSILDNIRMRHPDLFKGSERVFDWEVRGNHDNGLENTWWSLGKLKLAELFDHHSPVWSLLEMVGIETAHSDGPGTAEAVPNLRKLLFAKTRASVRPVPGPLPLAPSI